MKIKITKSFFCTLNNTSYVRDKELLVDDDTARAIISIGNAVALDKSSARAGVVDDTETKQSRQTEQKAVEQKVAEQKPKSRAKKS